ncbi:MAG TPA: hypothetical protein VKD90_08075 [Gemmataceae bacterium]|nr:hypothetical protein [Gemmataceae bacterium]
MSFWQKLFGGAKPPADERSAATIDRAAPSDGGEVPYGIADRPMPEGEDLDILLPHRVGPYVREPVKPPTRKGHPIYANYRNGAATVFVELGICASAGGAWMAVETAKAETSGEFPDIPQVVIRGRDVSCLRTVSPLGAFLAWTRGRYYFSAHAKGGEADLDAFVRAFPY